MKPIHVLLVIAMFVTSLGIANHESQIKELKDQISKLEKERKTIINKQYLVINKEEPKMIECIVTAYTNGYESTQKHKGEKGYGITKSGVPTKENHTVAADLNVFPLGTKLQIEGLEGVFVVEDTGGKIKGNKIDVFFENINNALAFGKRKLNITVVE